MRIHLKKNKNKNKKAGNDSTHLSSQLHRKYDMSIAIQASPGKNMKPYLKNNQNKNGKGVRLQ
jgi:hypothetical protein